MPFFQQRRKGRSRFFHLHIVSDASGETLTAIAKAATVQYSQIQAIKHSHPFVRTKRQLDQVIREIESAPGIVLYTIVNKELGQELEQRCQTLNVPCIAVLDPVLTALEAYLGTPSTPIVGGQHILDADYFRRMDAVNFSMLHDDGQSAETLDEADIVLVGVSRTSKTPTSIYLANRGFKTANVALVPGIPLPPQLETLRRPLVVGLVASAQRIAEVRRNRALTLADKRLDDYVNTERIMDEIAFTRRLCGRHRWQIIDVTRRSIEETAAAIIKMHEDRRQGQG